MSQNLAELFTKLDKNGNGSISRAEFDEALTELNITMQPSEVDGFFASMDTNGDGKISQPEFEAFLFAHQPENEHYGEILKTMNKSLPFLKRVSNFTNGKDLNLQNRSEFNLLLKTNTVTDFDSLNTKLSLKWGFDNALTESELGDKMPTEGLIYLKFVCENPSLVADGLKEHLNSLLEFLKGMDPTAEQMLQGAEFEVVALSNGVALFVNIDNHPILGAYLGMAMQFVSALKELDPSFDFKIGSSKNLDDENLVGGSMYFGLNSNCKSLVDGMINSAESPLNQQLNGQLEQFVGKMGIDQKMLLSFLNAESLNVSLIMKEANEASYDFKFSLKDQAQKMAPMLDENPIVSLIRSMTFLKEGSQLLRDNGVSEMVFGRYFEGFNLKVNLKADIGFLLDLVFTEEEE